MRPRKSPSPEIQDVYDVLEAAEPSLLRPMTLRWLEGLTADQIDVVRSVYEGFAGREEPVQSLLRYLLDPIANNGNTVGLYDTLALSNGFIVPKVLECSQYSFRMPQQVVIGLRQSPTNSLDLSTPEKQRDLEALAGFAFEVLGRGIRGGFSHFYVRGHKLQGIRYEDPELIDLVLHNTDRLEQLMCYAIDRKSFDPTLLSLLMNDSNVSALTDGMI